MLPRYTTRTAIAYKPSIKRRARRKKTKTIHSAHPVAISHLHDMPPNPP